MEKGTGKVACSGAEPQKARCKPGPSCRARHYRCALRIMEICQKDSHVPREGERMLRGKLSITGECK